jgi:hypothetical protein
MHTHFSHRASRHARRRPALTTLLALGIVLTTLTACGGGDATPVTTVDLSTVPAEAATSTAAAMQFMQRLSNSNPATADATEPIVITADMAVSDTDEPAPLP